MQRILSSFLMNNAKYCGVLIIKKCLERRFERFYKSEEPTAKEGMIASRSYPFFKIK